MNNTNSVDTNTGGNGHSQGERLPDLVVFSHLIWDGVFQRPQHLMNRFARERRVFFVEEPVWDPGPARVDVEPREGGLSVVVMHLPYGLDWGRVDPTLAQLVDEALGSNDVRDFVSWYYSPMFTEFTKHLKPLATVYDCMDELSAFKFAAADEMRKREAELLRGADLVFTGGQSLYEAKRDRHPHVYAFPSSVDTKHFNQARQPQREPADQAEIPHPRLGYFGVIDERIDLDLLAGVAKQRPDWHLVMLGPVYKIEMSDLPEAENIHYLGKKDYQDLPAYLAGWDVALMPFAQNEHTRFISPTKTPEYLAGGKPVVSTPIRDVVRPYGEKGLVRIADSPAEFVAAAEAAMQQDATERRPEWLQKVDAHLAQMSWDSTWAQMKALIEEVIDRRRATESSTAKNPNPRVLATEPLAEN